MLSTLTLIRLASFMIASGYCFGKDIADDKKRTRKQKKAFKKALRERSRAVSISANAGSTAADAGAETAIEATTEADVEVAVDATTEATTNASIETTTADTFAASTSAFTNSANESITMLLESKAFVVTMKIERSDQSEATAIEYQASVNGWIKLIQDSASKLGLKMEILNEISLSGEHNKPSLSCADFNDAAIESITEETTGTIATYAAIETSAANTSAFTDNAANEVTAEAAFQATNDFITERAIEIATDETPSTIAGKITGGMVDEAATEVAIEATTEAAIETAAAATSAFTNTTGVYFRKDTNNNLRTRKRRQKKALKKAKDLRAIATFNLTSTCRTNTYTTASANAFMNVADMGDTTEAAIEATTEVAIETTTEASIETTTEASIETTTEAAIEATTEAAIEDTTEAAIGTAAATTSAFTNTTGVGFRKDTNNNLRTRKRRQKKALKKAKDLRAIATFNLTSTYNLNSFASVSTNAFISASNEKSTRHTEMQSNWLQAGPRPGVEIEENLNAGENKEQDEAMDLGSLTNLKGQDQSEMQLRNSSWHLKNKHSVLQVKALGPFRLEF